MTSTVRCSRSSASTMCWLYEIQAAIAKDREWKHQRRDDPAGEAAVPRGRRPHRFAGGLDCVDEPGMRLGGLTEGFIDTGTFYVTQQRATSRATKTPRGAGRGCLSMELFVTARRQRVQTMATKSSHLGPWQPPETAAWDGAGDVVAVDLAVGRGLRELVRLAVGVGRCRAALGAGGEAPVDAVAVGVRWQ